MNKATMGNEKKKQVASPPKNERIGMIDRKEYERLKRRAIRFETVNRKYILVVPCSGNEDWCEMGDCSALIYKNEVCDRLGVPVTMVDDLDSYYNQFEVGRIRTRGFDAVRRRLQQAGVYKAEIKKDKCMIFELSRGFTQEELEIMRKDELTRQMELNTIVKVEFTDPTLYQILIEVGTRTHRICMRKMDKLSSITNGKRIVTLMDMTIRDYYDLTMLKMSDQSRLEIWKKMAEQVRCLLVELQIVAGLKIWQREACVKLGERMMALKERIERNLESEAKRHRK